MSWLLWDGGLFGWLFAQVGDESVNELICEVVEDTLYLLLKVVNVMVGVVEVVDFAHPLGEGLWTAFGEFVQLFKLVWGENFEDLWWDSGHFVEGDGWSIWCC